jgi:hypothetical protein
MICSIHAGCELTATDLLNDNADLIKFTAAALKAHTTA